MSKILSQIRIFFYDNLQKKFISINKNPYYQANLEKSKCGFDNPLFIPLVMLHLTIVDTFSINLKECPIVNKIMFDIDNIRYYFIAFEPPHGHQLINILQHHNTNPETSFGTYEFKTIPIPEKFDTKWIHFISPLFQKLSQKFADGTQFEDNNMMEGQEVKLIETEGSGNCRYGSILSQLDIFTTNLFENNDYSAIQKEVTREIHFLRTKKLLEFTSHYTLEYNFNHVQSGQGDSYILKKIFDDKGLKITLDNMCKVLKEYYSDTANFGLESDLAILAMYYEINIVVIEKQHLDSQNKLITNNPQNLHFDYDGQRRVVYGGRFWGKFENQYVLYLYDDIEKKFIILDNSVKRTEKQNFFSPKQTLVNIEEKFSPIVPEPGIIKDPVKFWQIYLTDKNNNPLKNTNGPLLPTNNDNTFYVFFVKDKLSKYYYATINNGTYESITKESIRANGKSIDFKSVNLCITEIGNYVKLDNIYQKTIGITIPMHLYYHNVPHVDGNDEIMVKESEIGQPTRYEWGESLRNIFRTDIKKFYPTKNIYIHGTNSHYMAAIPA